MTQRTAFEEQGKRQKEFLADLPADPRSLPASSPRGFRLLPFAFCLLPFAFCLLPWSSAADDKPATATPAPSSRDVQDLIFFAEDRPVLIRLDVRIDGQPYRDAFDAAWNDFLQHLFRYLDRDGDGFLSPEEAERAPAPALLLPGAWSGDPGNPVHFAFNFRVLDANGDGKVSLEELSTYYRDYGGGAFQVQLGAGRASTGRFLEDSLFERLNQNKDGKLTKDELARAASLMRLDLDGDEMLTPQELLGNPSAPAGGGAPPPAGPAAEPAFFLITSEDSHAELAAKILGRYGRGVGRTKVDGLSRKDLGLDEATFNRLDANKDGRLDAEELAKFTQRPADLELIVRLGRMAPGEPRLDVVVPPGGQTSPLAPAVQKTPNGLGIQLGKTLVELFVNEGSLRMLPAGRQFYRDQFAAADADHNGFVDRNEARQNRFFALWFDVMDRGGTGKVNEQDFLAFLDQVHDPLARVLACRPAFLASAEGHGLFDLLDKDRDGRLGLRELREAPQVLTRLNRAKAGFLRREDIPRSYRLAFSLGQPSFNRHGGNTVVVVPHAAPQALGVGPLWFRKMDRNHDGDVSPNEFLGTAEEFERLDTNKDGLISVEEAEQADARLRNPKPDRR